MTPAKFFQSLLSSFCVCVCVYICVLLAQPASAASDEQIKSFKEALASYNDLFGKQSYAKSLPYAQKSVELGKELYGVDSKSYVALNHNLARNYLRLQQPKEALDVLNSMNSLYGKAYGENAPELIDYYLDRADAQRGADYQSNWTRSIDDAVSLARKILGKESADYALLLIDTGHIEVINQHNGEGKINDGFELLKKVAPQHPRMGYANFVMGKIKMSHERYDDAIEYLTACLDSSNNNSKASLDASLKMTALGFLAVALEKTDQSEAATQRLNELGRIKESLGDRRAEPIFTVKPEFPSVSSGERIKAKEGMVQVSFDIDERGFTTNHSIYLLVGSKQYGDAAIAAVKKFRYAPLFQGGQPVAISDAKYTFKFLLQQ